ncbi:MAG TPA: hypothetical protein VL125_06105 [Pelobium sp.]|nr:hypothetical protein [Pelobium sp.]
MLTIFTTTKKFVGHTAVIQNNAITSWTKLGVPVEIIIFGKIEGEDSKMQNLSFIEIKEVNSFEGRIPYINDMFHKASRLAKYDHLCFLNADIILTSPFIKTIQCLFSSGMKQYLAVGQRLDFDVTREIDFEDNWIDSFIKENGEDFKLHPPMGSDIFIFPKNQYRLGAIPDLLVGRPGWDLWMIYNARRVQIPVIDITNSYLLYHQNHDYSHKNLQTAIKDDKHNYRFLPNGYEYAFTLEFCNYRIINQKIVQNFFNGDFNKHFTWQNYFANNSISTRVKSKLGRFLVKLLYIITR